MKITVIYKIFEKISRKNLNICLKLGQKLKNFKKLFKKFNNN